MISMEESRCNYALRMLLYLAIIMVARSSENGTNNRPVMEPPIEMMEAYTRGASVSSLTFLPQLISARWTNSDGIFLCGRHNQRRGDPFSFFS